MIKAIMPCLEYIKILKIILYAIFLRVWYMCNTIPLILKEFFQAFAWYIYNFFYDELIFIIVVIMCFYMETIVTDIFL